MEKAPVMSTFITEPKTDNPTSKVREVQSSEGIPLFKTNHLLLADMTAGLLVGSVSIALNNIEHFCQNVFSDEVDARFSELN